MVLMGYTRSSRWTRRSTPGGGQGVSGDARRLPPRGPFCVCVGWRTRTVLPKRAGGGPTSPPSRDGVSLPLPPARARSPSPFPPDRAGASTRAASACSRCHLARAHRPAVSSTRAASFSTRAFGCIRPCSAAWRASCASAASTTSPPADAASPPDPPRRPGAPPRHSHAGVYDEARNIRHGRTLVLFF